MGREGGEWWGKDSWRSNHVVNYTFVLRNTSYGTDSHLIFPSHRTKGLPVLRHIQYTVLYVAVEGRAVQTRHYAIVS